MKDVKVFFWKEDLANPFAHADTINLQTEAVDFSEVAEALPQQMEEELGRNEAEAGVNIAALESLSKNMLNKFSLHHRFSSCRFL